MIDDHGVRCFSCQDYMTAVEDWLIVPLSELVYTARWNNKIDKDWYWCSECDKWLHLPTFHLMGEIPF